MHHFVKGDLLHVKIAVIDKIAFVHQHKRQKQQHRHAQRRDKGHTCPRAGLDQLVAHTRSLLFVQYTRYRPKREVDISAAEWYTDGRGEERNETV